MFIVAGVFAGVAVLAAWFAHKQGAHARSETVRTCALMAAVLAVLFVAGGAWKWGTA